MQHDDEAEFQAETYQSSAAVDPSEIRTALTRLELFEDPYLSVQAWNLGMVDVFCMKLEDKLLQSYSTTGRTPQAEASFLTAQSQMWVFAAYELLRTWRQLAKDTIKWSRSGGLPGKIQGLREDVGFLHPGRSTKADLLERVLHEPARISKIEDDLRRTHIPFARMEALRVAVAKHEDKGKKNSVAYAPGAGRINRMCGAIDFELSVGRCILGEINRRDVANDIRAIAAMEKPPSLEELKSFDAFMAGPPVAFQME